MTHAGYVVSGWVLVGGVLGTYAWLTVHRGRRAARRAPESSRPWR